MLPLPMLQVSGAVTEMEDGFMTAEAQDQESIL
jgi:hypothetical protein